MVLLKLSHFSWARDLVEMYISTEADKVYCRVKLSI